LEKEVETLDDSVNVAIYNNQIGLPTEIEVYPESAISEIREILQDQSKQINKLRYELGHLSKGNTKTFNILSQQQELFQKEITEALELKMMLLEKGMIKIYQYLEKDSMGKELKSGQQLLLKAIEANDRKTTNNISYLDWKQIAIIITAIAMISSLCSLAAFQVASNWKTDQPKNQVEKPLKTKSKKNPK
jgi:hypothetical protein